MKVTFLCSDPVHPVNSFLECWVVKNKSTHIAEVIRSKNQLSGGDILFLVSCSEIITRADRSAYRFSLVLHASDLPRGRGWSPHIWEIVNGAEHITLSLLEAADNVDCGRIWRKARVAIPKHALWDEINEALFSAEIELIDFAVSEAEKIRPSIQDESIEPTYYPRRKPSDSQLDPHQSILAQFDKIRVSDPSRFPAYFDLHGHRYKLTLEKIDAK